MFRYERDKMDALIVKNAYLQNMIQIISEFYEGLIDKYITDETIRKEITSKLIKAIAEGTSKNQTDKELII